MSDLEYSIQHFYLDIFVKSKVKASKTGEIKLDNITVSIALSTLLILQGKVLSCRLFLTSLNGSHSLHL